MKVILHSLLATAGCFLSTTAPAADAKLPAQIPVPRAYPVLEGAKPANKYSTELTKRIDEIHKVTYNKWIWTSWATMLMKQGIVPPADRVKLAGALHEFWPQASAGMYLFFGQFGSASSYVQKKHGKDLAAWVTVGTTTPPARQMVAVRHYLLKEIAMLHDLRQSLLDVASEHAETVMPGYTHIRHAQPTTFGHYLLSVHDPIERSMQTLEDGCRLMSLSELGCGALAGTSWPVDRDLVARDLGMEGVIENANDAVAYTDGFVVVVAGVVNVMNAASRMALDLNFWSGEEYGFLKFKYEGLSHMMPQKSDNQPYLERVRVGAARMLGHMTEVSAMGMRAPHGDMLEGLHMQDATLGALDSLDEFLSPMIKQLHEMDVRKERMLAMARTGYSGGTEVANHLVRQHGLNYRLAHAIVHDFVLESTAKGIPSREASATVLEAAAQKHLGRKLGLSEAKLRQLLDPVEFVKAVASNGGAAPKEVRRMIDVRRTRLAAEHQRLLRRVEALEEAQSRLLADLKIMQGPPSRQ